MKWFLLIMGGIFILLFIGICVVDKIMVKENNDPRFHEKMERKREKWKRYEPIEKFFYNLFGWALVLLFIYYIALG